MLENSVSTVQASYGDILGVAVELKEPQARWIVGGFRTVSLCFSFQAAGLASVCASQPTDLSVTLFTCACSVGSEDA